MMGSCSKCRFLDFGPCPVLDRTDVEGFDGVEKCNYKSTVEALFQSGFTAGVSWARRNKAVSHTRVEEEPYGIQSDTET